MRTTRLRIIWISMATVQLLTAAAHALSFLAEPQATDETGKQLLHLMMTYREDLGAGFHRTTFQIFTALSSCFSLLYLLAGLVNVYLWRSRAPLPVMRGIAGIQALVLGISFVVMATLTFLPPIVLTGISFMLCVAAWMATGRQAKGLS